VTAQLKLISLACRRPCRDFPPFADARVQTSDNIWRHGKSGCWSAMNRWTGTDAFPGNRPEPPVAVLRFDRVLSLAVAQTSIGGAGNLPGTGRIEFHHPGELRRQRGAGCFSQAGAAAGRSIAWKCELDTTSAAERSRDRSRRKASDPSEGRLRKLIRARASANPESRAFRVWSCGHPGITAEHKRGLYYFIRKRRVYAICRPHESVGLPMRPTP